MQSILSHISACRLKFKWILVISVLTACVDRITFKVPTGEKFLVVEGLITDQPGPYFVRVSRSFTTDQGIYDNQPVYEAKVSLYEDNVLLEELTDPEGNGVFRTTNVTGVVGRTYHIIIETSDGQNYMSEPELLRPVGEITAIRSQFEARTKQTANGEVNGDRFNIYIDSNITDEQESFVRWRFAGTYLYRTNPEFAYIMQMGARIPTPAECSGYIRVGAGIKYQSACTCCTCWVTERDDQWLVGTSEDVTEAGYRNIFVGQANVTKLTFLERYHVEIEQMSLSPVVYEFFRQLEAQADGVESLFQPATGAIKGNVIAVNSEETVLGVFYASSIKSKSLDLLRSDVPYTLQLPDTIRIPCTAVRGSSNVKPDYW